METQILCEDFLRAKLANVFLRVDLFAAILHARDLQDATFGDLDLQMILNTVLALLMPTRQPKHLACFVSLSTDRACHLLAFLDNLVFLSAVILTIEIFFSILFLNSRS